MDEKSAGWMNGIVASSRCVAVNYRCDDDCELKDTQTGGWEPMACYLKLRAICQTDPQKA